MKFNKIQKNKSFHLVEVSSTWLKCHIKFRPIFAGYNFERSKGFTLIELMIATTLFTIVMVMGVGSLVVSSNSAKSAQKLRISVDNVNFAMESMTRELRMGTYYYCGEDEAPFTPNVYNDCANGGNIIVFTPQQIGVTPASRVSYWLKPRANGTNSLQRCENNQDNCSAVVSPDVNIETLKFYVNGSNTSEIDSIQPSVRILIRGIVLIKGEPKSFTLQTMASQRSTEVSI